MDIHVELSMGHGRFDPGYVRCKLKSFCYSGLGYCSQVGDWRVICSRVRGKRPFRELPESVLSYQTLVSLPDFRALKVRSLVPPLSAAFPH